MNTLHPHDQALVPAVAAAPQTLPPAGLWRWRLNLLLSGSCLLLALANLGLLTSAWLAPVTSAQAHGSRIGSLEIDHPYATPTPPAARVGAVYFRAIENTGKQADRLVAARTALAERVEIHHSAQVDGVMQMRAQDSLLLPAGSRMELRHGRDGYHLMLVGLRQPLKVGDTFKLSLRFEQAGEREVNVWVQQVRGGHDHSQHKH
jgi:copper(I)-binding protein